VPAAHYFYYMSRNRYLFWSENFGVRPVQVASAIALDVVRTAGSMVRSALLRTAPRNMKQPGLFMYRQMRGAWRGSLDYLGGRLGPMR
jgi:hypothetical protein